MKVNVRPHPWIERRGKDLHVDLPVTLAEAWLGATITLPTFHGEVNLKIPPKTSSGARLRLKGKGVQTKGEEAGALMCRIMIVLPKGELPDLDQLAEALNRDDEGTKLRDGLRV